MVDSSKTRGPERLQIIDLTRTFSILSVMAMHLKPTLPLPPPALRWLWDHFQRNGAYGVTCFFVVSGFLITRLIDQGKGGMFNPRFKEFYVRRMARIFPLVFLIVFAGVFLTYGLHDPSKKFAYIFKEPSISLGPFFWVSLATFSYNWFQVLNPLNYPGIYWASLWSLSVEEQFYLFYPPILKGLRTERHFLAFLCVIILIGLGWRLGLYCWGVEGSAPSLRSSFGAFDQISLGALLYLVSRKLKGYLARRPGLCLSLCLFGAFVTVLTYLATFTADRLDMVYGPTLISFGLFVFLLGGFHLNIFESKHLRIFSWPGKYSYGNYLYNAFILYLIHSFLWSLNILLAFSIFVIASTLVSAFSFHFFETPANRAIRKFFGLKAG